MLREFIPFTIVGGIAFFVDVGILYLIKPIMGLYWGRAVSFLCAVLVTWLFNRYFTFKLRKPEELSLLHEFTRYLGVMMGGGMLNYLVYALLTSTYALVAAQPVWGVAAGSFTGLIFNFIFARYFVFKPL